jgi:hypothetical protein
MSVRDFIPNDGSLWSIRANNISGNYSQDMNLDPSSNISFSRNGTTIATLGSNFIVSSIIDGLDVSGTYFSNSVSALRIPADTSNNRPAGQAGYIRYNTTTDLVEYWNASTNAWLSIAEPSPNITGISPNYVPEDSSFNYTITGTNFNSSSSVQFIGDVDTVVYNAFGPTNFISDTTITATNTLAMSDASINTGFFVKVTNTDSGLNFTSPSTLLSYNKGPFWNTADSTNLGTGISASTYTISNEPFQDLSASDLIPNLPLTYSYASSPVGASGVLLDTSNNLGKLYGLMPTITTSVTSVYSFTSIVTDASYAVSPIRTFFFTVSVPLASITGGTVSIGYTDSEGNNFRSSPPYSGGYTVYVFTNGTSSFVTTQFFPPYVSYLVVGGGGAGGAGNAGGSAGGGGGAGGYLTGYKAITAGTTYSINVGVGGTGTTTNGNSGGASSISGTGISLSAAGGGGGADNSCTGVAGGSGGGAGLRKGDTIGIGGAGNTPSTTPAQGNAGGTALIFDTAAQGRGGGGGSALARGGGGYGNSQLNSNFATGPGGTGGSGISNNIRGTGVVVYSGGGGAGGYDRLLGLGGSGGGGSGSGSTGTIVVAGYATPGTAGTANTGGGGGGTATGSGVLSPVSGGAGGSGIVILRHLTNIISSTTPTAFTINGSTSFGSPINGTYLTASTYQTGTTTTPGTATVTYVDASGANPRAFALGAYSGGFTVVTFLTTTPVSPYTNASPLALTSQVQRYGNTTDFSFNAISPFPAQIEYLIVAGGGTGAKGTGGVTYGGGGGAGQVLAGMTSITPGTTYTVSVGSGAVMDPNAGSTGAGTVGFNTSLSANGINSSAFSLTASGGTGGNGGSVGPNGSAVVATSWNPAATTGTGGTSGNGFLGGLNAPNGANGTNPGGGGGGASDFGRPPNFYWTNSGGYGIASQISGTLTGYAAGGGGGGDPISPPAPSNFIGGSSPAGVVIGGTGGGGGAPSPQPTAGTANTGSGGGGMRSDDIGCGGGGGTGIIIIKFPSFVC